MAAGTFGVCRKVVDLRKWRNGNGYIDFIIDTIHYVIDSRTLLSSGGQYIKAGI